MSYSELDIAQQVGLLWRRIEDMSVRISRRKWEIQEKDAALRSEIEDLRTEIENFRAETESLRTETNARLDVLSALQDAEAERRNKIGILLTLAESDARYVALLKASEEAIPERVGRPPGKSEKKTVIACQVHARWYLALKDAAKLKELSMAELLRRILEGWLADRTPDPDYDFPLPEKRTRAPLSGDTQTWAVSTSVSPDVLEQIDEMSNRGWLKFKLARYGLRGTRSTVIRAALGDWLWKHSLVGAETFPPMWYVEEDNDDISGTGERRGLRV